MGKKPLVGVQLSLPGEYQIKGLDNVKQTFVRSWLPLGRDCNAAIAVQNPAYVT